MMLARASDIRASRTAVALLALAVVLVVVRLVIALPGLGAAQADAGSEAAGLVLRYAILPRLAVALLGGAMMALAGALFQHALDNPLAGPSTLGVTAGAQLAIVLAAVLVPGLAEQHRFLAAVIGGAIATLVVMAVALRRGGGPSGVVVAGLAVGLFCLSAATALQLANQEDLGATLLWRAGALEQTDWSAPRALWPVFLVACALTAILLRPLSLLSLDDASSKGAGLDPRMVRTAAMALAALLATAVTAVVGPLAFVEMAAPIIAVSLGARRLPARLAISALAGAVLLLGIDQVVAAIQATRWGTIPTGAITALLAAPLVLWRLPHLRRSSSPRLSTEARPPTARRGARTLALAGIALVAVIVLTVTIGRDGIGWTFVTPASWADLMPWRLPRTLAALTSGALLAEAGAVLQRNTGNPMAGPEVLGLGAAAIGGFLVVLIFDPGAPRPIIVAGGTLAALAHFGVLTWRGAKSRFTSEQVVLAGLVLGAAVNAVATVVLSLGDARGPVLMAWIAGTTTMVNGKEAALGLAVALPLAVGAMAFRRALDLLPLGEVAASACGLSVPAARFATTLFAALMTALAVLVAGPVAFVGLIGPHLARRLGFGRAGTHLPASALIGAGLMVVADWLGRTVAAPFEIPAGLTASLIGVPYLLALTVNRHRGGVT